MQMTTGGAAVSEKEWRRMNLEWERRRRDALEEEQKRRRREQEERKHRMELRQKSKQEEADRRKVEERRRRERENMAGLRDALKSRSNNDKLDMEVSLVKSINQSDKTISSALFQRMTGEIDLN